MEACEEVQTSVGTAGQAEGRVEEGVQVQTFDLLVVKSQAGQAWIQVVEASQVERNQVGQTLALVVEANLADSIFDPVVQVVVEDLADLNEMGILLELVEEAYLVVPAAAEGPADQRAALGVVVSQAGVQGGLASVLIVLESQVVWEGWIVVVAQAFRAVVVGLVDLVVAVDYFVPAAVVNQVAEVNQVVQVEEAYQVDQLMVANLTA